MDVQTPGDSEHRVTRPTGFVIPGSRMTAPDALPPLEDYSIPQRPPAAAVPRWVRVLLYLSCWLPVLVDLGWLVPRFAPLFTRLEEKGELDPITQVPFALARFNRECWFLPLLSLVLVLVLVDEAVISVLRRRRLLSLCWTVFFALLGLVAQGLIIRGMQGPVYRQPGSSDRLPLLGVSQICFAEAKRNPTPDTAAEKLESHKARWN